MINARKLSLKALALAIVISSIPTVPVEAVPVKTGEKAQEGGEGVVVNEYVDETRTAKVTLNSSNGEKITGSMEITFPMERVYDRMRATALHSANAYLAQYNDIYFIPSLEDFPVDPNKMFTNVVMASTSEGESPIGGDHKMFADVIDDYFDAEVELTAVTGEVAREQNFIGSDGKTKTDSSVENIARYNTSKKVYSKNENSRTLQTLGYDLLLEDEKCIMGEENGSFVVDYMPTYAKSSLSSKYLKTKTIVMDLYKALNQYLWDIKVQFTDDFRIRVDQTPLDLPTDHLTARGDLGGVYPLDAACWIWASRTNPELYWDTCRKDRIFGGSKNVNTQHMYSGETYSVTFNKSAEQTMTLGEFCAVARAMMELYGEPVMTEREQLIMLQVYGFNLPDNLTKEQSDAVRYMVAKGIIDPTNVDFHKYVTFDDISELLLRIADKSARMTFKEAQAFNTNSILFNEGYINGSLDDVADISDVDEVADLENDPYYDYFVQSKDGFSNFFLLQDSALGNAGNVVTDNISIYGLTPETEYQNYTPKPTKKKKGEKTGEDKNTAKHGIAFDFDGTLDVTPGSKVDDGPNLGVDTTLKDFLLSIGDRYPNVDYAFITAGGKHDKRYEKIGGTNAESCYFGKEGPDIWERSYNYKNKGLYKTIGVKAGNKRAKWCAENDWDILVDDNLEACLAQVQNGKYAIYLGSNMFESNSPSTTSHFYNADHGFDDGFVQFMTGILGPPDTGNTTEGSNTATTGAQEDPLPIFVNKGITEEGFYHFRVLKQFYKDSMSEWLEEHYDGSNPQQMTGFDYQGALADLRAMMNGDKDLAWDMTDVEVDENEGESTYTFSGENVTKSVSTGPSNAFIITDLDTYKKYPMDLSSGNTVVYTENPGTLKSDVGYTQILPTTADEAANWYLGKTTATNSRFISEGKVPVLLVDSYTSDMNTWELPVLYIEKGPGVSIDSTYYRSQVPEGTAPIDAAYNIGSVELKIPEENASNMEVAPLTDGVKYYIKTGVDGLIAIPANVKISTIELDDPNVQVVPQQSKLKDKRHVIAVRSKTPSIVRGTMTDNSGKKLNIVFEFVKSGLPKIKDKNKKTVNVISTQSAYITRIRNPQKNESLLADKTAPAGGTIECTDYILKVPTKSRKPSAKAKDKTTYNTKKKIKIYIPNCSSVSTPVVSGYQMIEGTNESYEDVDTKQKGQYDIKAEKKCNGYSLTTSCVDKILDFTVSKTDGTTEHYTINVQHSITIAESDGLVDIGYNAPEDVLEKLTPTKSRDEDESTQVQVTTLDSSAGDPEVKVSELQVEDHYQLEAGGGVYLLEYGDTTIDKRLDPDTLYVMRYTLDGQFISAYEWDEVNFQIKDNSPAVTQDNTVLALLYSKSRIDAYKTMTATVGEREANNVENSDALATELEKSGLNVHSGQDVLNYGEDFDPYNRLSFALSSKYIDSSRDVYNAINRAWLSEYSSKANGNMLADADTLTYTPLDAYSNAVMFQIPKSTWKSGKLDAYKFGGAIIGLDELQSNGAVGAKITKEFDVNGKKYTLTFITSNIGAATVSIVVKGISSIDVFRQNFSAPKNRVQGVANVYYNALTSGEHDVMIDIETLRSAKLIKSAKKLKDGSIFIITNNKNNVVLDQQGSTGRVYVGNTVFILPSDQKAYIQDGGNYFVNARALIGWGSKLNALVETNGKIEIILPVQTQDLNQRGVTTVYGQTENIWNVTGYNGRTAMSLANNYPLANYLLVIDESRTTQSKSRLLSEDSNDVLFYYYPKMNIDGSGVLNDSTAAHQKLANMGIHEPKIDSSYYGLGMIKLNRREQPDAATGQLGWASQEKTGLDGEHGSKKVFGYYFYPREVKSDSASLTKVQKETFTGGGAVGIPIVLKGKKLYNVMPNCYEAKEGGLFPSNSAPAFVIGKDTPQTDTGSQEEDTESTDENSGDDDESKPERTLSGNECYMWHQSNLGGEWKENSKGVTFRLGEGKIIPSPAGVFSMVQDSTGTKLKTLSASTSNKLYVGTMLAKKSGSALKLGNVTISNRADNLVAYRTQAVTSSQSYYALKPTIITTSGSSSFTGGLEEALSMAKILTDWDKYKFSSLVEHIDSVSSIFLILILNLIPRIGMLIFFVLMLLTTLQGNRLAEIFCEKVFDPVKVLTFNRQSFTTLDLKLTVLQSMLALALFSLVMDGHLIMLISWSVSFFGVLMNR